MDALLGVADAEKQRGRVVPRTVLAIVTVAWLCVVGIGMSWLSRYAATPGTVSESPDHWPIASHIERNPQQNTLIVFAHPRCPCTQATIAELERIVARCRDRVDICVLFYRPSEASPGWEQTTLWESTKAIPGIRVRCDQDGIEARKFGAATSGHTLLYGREGQLLFSGGITSARGHEGDNEGKRAILSLVQHGDAPQRLSAAVYGCSLHREDGAYDMERQR